MNILVCIKQVPVLETDISIRADGHTAAIDDIDQYRTNRFDEYALEAGLILNDALAQKNEPTENTIDLITVGPERAKEVLKRGLGMGADKAVHILCHETEDADPFQPASWIAQYARKKQYDLILTGALSEDLMQGQTGPVLAATLGWLSVSAVISIDIADKKQILKIQSELEGGERSVLTIELPAVLAVQPGINSPRYPSLSNLLRANRLRPLTLLASTLDKPEPRQTRVSIKPAEQKRPARVLAGSVEEKAASLMAILQQKSVLRRP